MGKTVELDVYPRGGHVLLRTDAGAAADAAQPRVVQEVAGDTRSRPREPSITSSSSRRLADSTRSCRLWFHASRTDRNVRRVTCSLRQVRDRQTGSERMRHRDGGRRQDGNARSRRSSTRRATASSSSTSRRWQTIPAALAIQPRRLGTVRLSGRIAPLESGETLAGREIRVLVQRGVTRCAGSSSYFDCFTQIGELVTTCSRCRPICRSRARCRTSETTTA